MQQSMSFSRHSRITPRESAFLDLGEDIWRSRPDLQEAFPSESAQGAAGFWYWLNWHGLDDAMNDRAPRLREVLPPMPPAHLAGRVFGEEHDRTQFLRSGLVNWRRFLEISNDALGWESVLRGRVLDFGGGCGRIARHFLPFSGRVDLDVCDVDPDAMEWLGEAMPWIKTTVTGHAPSLPYPDDVFDFIYAYSVFSHLPPKLARAWVKELCRALRPGGALVFTTLGDTVVRKITTRSVAYPFPKPEVLEARLDDWKRERRLFFPYEVVESSDPRNKDFFGEWDLTEYGNFFIATDDVPKAWCPHLEHLSSLAGPDDWQDFHLFRHP